MFTAPRLSTVPGALAFPADSELTVFAGLRTLWDWRLHMKVPQPASSFLLAPLAHCPGANRLVVVGFSKTGRSIPLWQRPFVREVCWRSRPFKTKQAAVNHVAFATLTRRLSQSGREAPFEVGQIEGREGARPKCQDLMGSSLVLGSGPRAFVPSTKLG